MSYLRVSTVSADVAIPDLGYTIIHPAVNFVISDQFSVEDIQDSVDLKTAINNGLLTAQRYNDGSWTTIAAVDFDSQQVYASYADIYEIVTTQNNQELVLGNNTALHHHDARYFTETELGSIDAPSGGSLIGIDDTNFDIISGDDVQEVLDSIDDAIGAVDLDDVYDNDVDGVMNIDGVSKPLTLKSDNSNDIVINRTNSTDTQDILRADVSEDELILGAPAVGALADVDVRVKKNLYVDGNIIFVGTITDTTVDEMNVTNANITLREGAPIGGDASLLIERGSTGADASLLWNETTDRWQAGLDALENTIALLELDEIVSGVWEFGGTATDPNMYLINKAAAPTTKLGTANQIPLAMINNAPAYYDKVNSKWVSFSRTYMFFTGRDNANNTNEYARCVGSFTSNQSSARLLRDVVLIGVSAQTTGNETWTVRIRKNGSVVNLASLAIGAASGGKDLTLNIDFNADDVIEVYIDGSQIDRPFITLEFAYRY